MQPCNYIPLESAIPDADLSSFDDLFDLDILCTEEGIYINITEEYRNA